MAYDLNTVAGPPDHKNPVGILYGKQGIGKTSFACAGPNAILLDVEKGADYIDCKRVKIDSLADCFGWIASLLAGGHGYQTLVIDSLDHLEPMVHAAIEQEAGMPLAKINGGYFKWRDAAREKWAKLIRGCEKFREVTGGAVWLVAHCKIKEIDDPRTAPYARFMLKLDDAAASFLAEKVDVVGYMDTDIATTESGEDRVIGVSNGKRKLFLDATCPAYAAKQRKPMPKFIELPSASEGYANFIAAFNK